MTTIVDDLNNFKYPNHITQDQKDLHKMAKYKHHTLGLQLEMYERAMNHAYPVDAHTHPC